MKKNTIIFTLVAFAIAFGIYIFSYLPKDNSLEILKEDFESESNIRSENQKVYEMLSKSKKSEIINPLSSEKKLYSSKEKTKMQKHIESVCNNSNIYFSFSGPWQKQEFDIKKRKIKRLKKRLTFSCSFLQLRRFVEMLENAPFLITISGIEIQRREDDLLVKNLEVSVYLEEERRKGE